MGGSRVGSKSQVGFLRNTGHAPLENQLDPLREACTAFWPRGYKTGVQSQTKNKA